MQFLGNFYLFPHKAPTVVSVLFSHGDHYVETQRTLMGSEPLTPIWGRNCIDSALLNSTQQNGYCICRTVFIFELLVIKSYHIFLGL